MIPKKSRGRVFGASLTAAEQKAMDIEIKRQLAEYDKKNSMEIDALILWLLHKEFGFGKVRLRRVHDRFNEALDQLLKRYEMDDKDGPWLCSFKLKEELGIDLEEWGREDGSRR